MIVPYTDSNNKKERTIGLLDGKINIQLSDISALPKKNYCVWHELSSGYACISVDTFR